MSDQTIRLSDAEREAAAADLGEHFAQGRLTADEHAERLEQVWAAKTRGEIAPIFRDLPSAYAAPAPRVRASAGAPPYSSPSSSWRDRGPRPGFQVPFFLVLAVLVTLSFFTHLPVILVGLLVWFVFVKRRGPWSRRW